MAWRSGSPQPKSRAFLARDPQSTRVSAMKITMIGHSTVLIEAAGKRVLTDPYFGLRGNPAYARVRPPARSREELTDVDLVLISHNHWDHTDRKFLRMLPPSAPVFA